MIIDEKLYYAGLVVCLTWNVIAVTAAWIKGEGEFIYIEGDLNGLLNISNFTNLTFSNSMHVEFGLVCCRCKNMVSGCYLLHIRGTWSICSVVSSIVSCF